MDDGEYVLLCKHVSCCCITPRVIYYIYIYCIYIVYCIYNYPPSPWKGPVGVGVAFTLTPTSLPCVMRTTVFSVTALGRDNIAQRPVSP
jgi:hypothetical protein